MRHGVRVGVSLAAGLSLLAAVAMLLHAGGVYGVFSDTERTSASLAASTDFPPLLATVDIDPDTLNPRSQGNFVMAYVELPEPWDVADIDLSTVKLAIEGEAATVSAESHPTEVGDHDGDGIRDRMVKFDRQAVLDLLAGKAGPVTLVVTGQVGSRTFEGSDTVNVLDPPTATPTPSATPSLTPTPTPTPTPTATVTPTPSPTPTATPTATETPEPAPAEQPDATATEPAFAPPEATPTAEPAVTATPADAETLTPGATATATPATEPTVTSDADR